MVPDGCSNDITTEWKIRYHYFKTTLQHEIRSSKIVWFFRIIFKSSNSRETTVRIETNTLTIRTADRKTYGTTRTRCRPTNVSGVHAYIRCCKQTVRGETSKRNVQNNKTPREYVLKIIPSKSVARALKPDYTEIARPTRTLCRRVVRINMLLTSTDGHGRDRTNVTKRG